MADDGPPTSVMDVLTDAQVAEFKEVFALFDVDGNGSVSAGELGTVMRSLGQNPTEDEISKMVAEVDDDGSGNIEFPEFLVMMAKRIRESGSGDKLIEAFRVFDKDATGFVSVAEFRNINAVGEEPIPEETLEAMIAFADPDGVGQLNYEEFVRNLLAPAS